MLNTPVKDTLVLLTLNVIYDMISIYMVKYKKCVFFKIYKLLLRKDFMDNLIILGAGQYGALVYEIAQSCGLYEKIDFLDDSCENAIGKIADYKKIIGKYNCAAAAIGNNDIRLDFLNMLKEAGFKLPAIISPRAWVSPSAKISEGVIIEPNATVSTAAEIGFGCLVSSGAVVNHNAVLCDGSHVNCNSTVTARAEVPFKKKLSCGEVF